jgi:hypothetical protein
MTIPPVRHATGPTIGGLPVTRSCKRIMPLGATMPQRHIAIIKNASKPLPCRKFVDAWRKALPTRKVCSYKPNAPGPFEQFSDCQPAPTTGHQSQKFPTVMARPRIEANAYGSNPAWKRAHIIAPARKPLELIATKRVHNMVAASTLGARQPQTNDQCHTDEDCRPTHRTHPGGVYGWSDQVSIGGVIRPDLAVVISVKDS